MTRAAGMFAVIRRALAGCTTGAASVNLSALGELILWKQITAELNGHTVTGLYSTSLGSVTVRTPYDSKSRQLGGSSTLVARILLRELAAEGKA
jgi:hypothetical protein